METEDWLECACCRKADRHVSVYSRGRWWHYWCLLAAHEAARRELERMKAIRPISKGRIVMYRATEIDEWPMLVTEVCRNVEATVEQRVFGVIFTNCSVRFVDESPYSEEKITGTWHWPEII